MKTYSLMNPYPILDIFLIISYDGVDASEARIVSLVSTYITNIMKIVGLVKF